MGLKFVTVCLLIAMLSSIISIVAGIYRLTNDVTLSRKTWQCTQMQNAECAQWSRK